MQPLPRQIHGMQNVLISLEFINLLKFIYESQIKIPGQEGQHS